MAYWRKVIRMQQQQSFTLRALAAPSALRPPTAAMRALDRVRAGGPGPSPPCNRHSAPGFSADTAPVAAAVPSSGAIAANTLVAAPWGSDLLESVAITVHVRPLVNILKIHEMLKWRDKLVPPMLPGCSDTAVIPSLPYRRWISYACRMLASLLWPYRSHSSYFLSALMSSNRIPSSGPSSQLPTLDTQTTRDGADARREGISSWVSRKWPCADSGGGGEMARWKGSSSTHVGHLHLRELDSSAELKPGHTDTCTVIHPQAQGAACTCPQNLPSDSCRTAFQTHPLSWKGGMP